MSEKRVDLFGLRVDDISLSQCTFLANESLKSKERRVFFTPNLEMLAGARRSEGICRMLNESSLSLPDGIGIKIVSRLLGIKIENTVLGIDFGEELMRIANESGARVFLLGGGEGVAEKAAKNLKARYKGIEICGTSQGYFFVDEEKALCRKINESGADILIVCRGFPRQEAFVIRSRDELYSPKVIACLGGTLDVWAGVKKRAPAFMQGLYLEWLWRIVTDKSFERLERFISSLSVVFEALAIWFKNILAKIGIKQGAFAYNRTDANS